MDPKDSINTEVDLYMICDPWFSDGAKGVYQDFTCYSSGFRGGSRGSPEPPSGAKLFYFHGECQDILCKMRQTNPPFQLLNPLLRNPGSAPVLPKRYI